MNILVTAGNTQVLIDRVRCITNIFSGRTGAGLALHAVERGHSATLLTSHPETVASMPKGLSVVSYQTFDDLNNEMGSRLTAQAIDCVIHCAAVSDYTSGGVYAPAAGTRFNAATATWESNSIPTLTDRSAGKVKSDEPELWLRLVRTPKLVDKIRTDWSFRGILVKFKLEVGIDEGALCDIAEKSRLASAANLMVANTLEGSRDWALLGPVHGRYEHIERDTLPRRLLDEVEKIHG